MNNPDQDTILRAMEDARRILREYLEPERRDAKLTVERLLAVFAFVVPERDDLKKTRRREPAGLVPSFLIRPFRFSTTRRPSKKLGSPPGLFLGCESDL